MPTWGGIQSEILASIRAGHQDALDRVRRQYIARVQQRTKRDLILYASKWTQTGGNASPEAVSIVDEDLQGLMEVVHGLTGPDLDLVLHSPGGSLEAAEALVAYLRSKFQHIRVVVPNLAMSAATMIACAADVIMLGKHSFLGPIDPQLIIGTPLGPRMVPAQAILQQFQQAVEECQDTAKLAAWLPMLSQYGPDLLARCRNASDMSQTLVERWLHTYMFKEHDDRDAKAKAIAEWLANHMEWKSHGRHIPRQELEAKGLVIRHLEEDQELQDLFLSVFHATTHTFDMSAAVKIIENHRGRAFIKQQRVIDIPAGIALPPGFSLPPGSQPPGSAPRPAKRK